MVGTQHTLVSGTGPAGGGNFALALDTSALAPGQFIEVEVSRAILSGGAQRPWSGGPVTLFGAGWSDSPLFRVPANIAYTVAIRLVGEAGGRSVPWSWERLDA